MEIFDKKKYYSRTSKWRERGVKGDLNIIYDIYLRSEKCKLCSIDLTVGKRSITTKTLHHNHQTGEFINVVCHRCNIKMNERNTSGYNGISYNKLKDVWRYRVNKKQLFNHKDKQKVIDFKVAEERLK